MVFKYLASRARVVSLVNIALTPPVVIGLLPLRLSVLSLPEVPVC